MTNAAPAAMRQGVLAPVIPTTFAAGLADPATRAATERQVGLDVTLWAFKRVCANIEGFGNKLNAAHREALMELVGSFTHLAAGHRRGRLAFPMPTGMGKTQSIVAWVAAVHACGRDDLSVAVAATKVEALCQLKRDMIDNGVPESRIGLVHSYRYDKTRAPDDPLPLGHASEPADEDAAERPFILVTHQRVKAGDLSRFNVYGKSARRLLIWDESLIVSDSRSMGLKDLCAEFARFENYLASDATTRPVYAHAIAALKAEEARQAEGLPPRLVVLPVIDDAARQQIENELRHRKLQDVPILRDFLNIAQEPLRVVSTGQGGGLIRYEIDVPRELESVAILDASYPIRELERMDPSITIGGSRAQAVKRYSRVTIHHLKMGSGRETVETSLRRARPEDRKVSMAVCKAIATMPVDEGVIVFTFKTHGKGIDCTARLKADLRDSGVDVAATLDGGRPRIVFMTWGSETSESRHSYCKHVVFAGVVRRSHIDLASALSGQADDPLRHVDGETLRRVEDSEIAHSLLQAMSRGSCRMIDDDQAHRMDAWLILKDEGPRALLQQAMPGVEWTTWKDKTAKPDGKREAMVERVRKHLSEVDLSIRSLSTTDLKRALSIAEGESKTFGRALKDALRSIEWRSVERSIVRA